MIDFRNKDVIVVELKKTVSSKSVNSVLQRKLFIYIMKNQHFLNISVALQVMKKGKRKRGVKKKLKKNKFAVREQLADPT